MSAPRVDELCDALAAREGTPHALLLAVYEVWPEAESGSQREQTIALASALLTLNNAVAKGLVVLKVLP